MRGMVFIRCVLRIVIFFWGITIKETHILLQFNNRAVLFSPLKYIRYWYEVNYTIHMCIHRYIKTEQQSLKFLLRKVVVKNVWLGKCSSHFFFIMFDWLIRNNNTWMVTLLIHEQIRRLNQLHSGFIQNH